MTRAEDLARDIVRMFEPKSVLHFGCVDAELVEALFSRGVSSFGLATEEIDLSGLQEAVADRIFVVHNQLLLSSASELGLPRYDLIVTTGYLNELSDAHLESVRSLMLEHSNQLYSQVLTRRQGGRHRLEWWHKVFPEAFFEEVVYH